ncbi:MAG: hypothetical protein M1835_001971, partial [Candelina submexicana]
MWSRITGKSNDKDEDRSSQPSRRKSDAHTSQPRRRSGSESIVSSTSSRRPARGDDRDRGFNPTSTSYATSSRSPYPATASASIASSYATASSNRPDDSILPPGLIRNSSLVDKVSRSGEGREERDIPRGSDRRRTRSTSRERKHRKHRSGSREAKDSKLDKKEYREKKDRRGEVDRGVSISEDIYQGTSRAGEVPTYGSASFNAQVGSSNFTQFPGQFDGAVSGSVASPAQATPATPHPPANFSSHVPDQFPGQFPNQSSAPYRPPLSAKEGGPGLASEYYGDAGESVVHQPGVRPKPPDLIIGAEPHLMAASPISAPPPEPSASGGVGAAAAYFTSSGTNDTYQQTSSPSFRPPKPDKPSRPGTASRPGKSSSLSGPVMTAGGAALGYAAAGSNESSKYNPSTGSNSTSFYQQGPNPVVSGAIGYASQNVISNSQDSYHSSSAPVIPTVGAAAPDAAAGYINGHEGSSSRPPQNQSYHQPESISGDAGNYLPGSAQRTSSKTTTYVISSSGKASKVGKHSSESNLPLYVAGAVGAAGLTAAAHHQHYSSSHSSVSGSPYPSGQMKLSTPSRTRVGPLEKFVNFWKDHEGVARFEEYTQYIGVCKYCFSPDSSPRDAPRKHHYRRRGSRSKYGSSARIDKESRYFSSDSDNRRKSGKSWLATGIAGYGLAKVGRSIMSQGRESVDIYSAKSDRTRRSTTSLGGRSEISTRRPSHRSRSNDRFETGIMSDGKVYKKDNHPGSLGGSDLVTVDPSRHRSRSRSGSCSHDQHGGLAGAALGAAIGTSAAGSRSRRR